MKQGVRQEISRRHFAHQCAAACLGLCAANSFINPSWLLAGTPKIRPAAFWKSLSKKATQCELCPNECIRKPGEDGLCHSRGNRDGILSSLTYGRPSIIALDPIEKSPLFHFQVRDKVFSIATAGCNLTCAYCQNWQITQAGPAEVKTYDLPPAEVIKRAEKHGVDAISFFYSEPTIYFEYMKDIALLAKATKMKTVCVTAGYINPEPLKQLIPLIDAFVVGLKGFDDAFYTERIGCPLEPVKRTLKILAQSREKPWFEIVNLLVTGMNDNEASIEAMVQWLAKEIGRDVPLHFTRFRPDYKLKNLPMTPVGTIDRAYKTAIKAGLHYAYVGNLPGHKGSNTICPGCGRTVIERTGFLINKNVLKNGKCSCGVRIPGHWI